ncbi:MAG: hypothetical protein AAF196_07830 [Planctomycetota bacterium]
MTTAAEDSGSAPEPKEPARTAVLWVGERPVELEPDLLHVVGSADTAGIRIVHRSVLPAHAFVSWTQGVLQVEPVGTATVRVDAQPIDSPTGIENGAILSFGDIVVRVEIRELTAAPVVSAPVFVDSPSAPTELDVSEAIAMFESGTAAAHAADASSSSDSSFGELMADQLRRAPWFLISITVHLIAFLVLRVLVPDVTTEPRRYAFVDVQMDRNERASDLPSLDTPEAPQVETLEHELDDLVQESVSPVPEFEQDDAAASAPREFEPDLGLVPTYDSQTAFLSFGRDEDLLESIGSNGGTGSGGTGDRFREEVRGLRRVGLDLMIVFDSTGSMDGVLESARAQLETMLEVLQRLVPSARVGIVTYRDRGPDERYQTRVLDLDDDIYQALLFMRTVEAGGGGDIPEDVLGGLGDAFGQSWTSRGRRVTVLVGDAPAHPDTRKKVLQSSERFGRRDNATVHTILTTARRDGAFNQDAVGDFQDIARRGGGEFSYFEGDDAVLRQILTLSIGSEFGHEVDRAYQVLNREAIRGSRRRVRVSRLGEDLRSDAIDPALVRRLGASRDPEVADALIDIAAKRSYPATGRHAAAYALQDMLGLRRPPLVPGGSIPQPLTEGQERALRARVDFSLRGRERRGR